MTHEERIRQLAGEARSYFEYRKRHDETGYWTLEEGAPEWVRKLAFAAHKEGKILPDDFRYLFVVESLEALAEDPDEPESLLESEAYTSQLLAWLDAYPSYRMDIVDAAVDQFGWNGLFEALEAGQLMEKKEVLALVRAFLEKKLEED
ncbi:MAG UNVERIFIED_CONTAM: hypothetical protein LOD86_16815 [Thermobifida fusca]